MNILTLNCGSSSVKTSVISMPAEKQMCAISIMNIGSAAAFMRTNAAGHSETVSVNADNHQSAVRLIFDRLTPLSDTVAVAPDAIGHRVVHGGTVYQKTVRVTTQVMDQLDSLSQLAPLHNPVNLLGIREALAHYRHVSQFAVFDTAFHATIPEYAHRYMIPEPYFQKYGIRKYGFHGISHHYISLRAAAILQSAPEDLRIISCHLGNGSSVCAINRGKSVDTTMGFTPLDGIPMGTRCGSIDPGAVLYLMDKEGLSPDAMMRLLNRESGFLGVSGKSANLKEIQESADRGDKNSSLVIDALAYAVQKQIGAYQSVLGQVDAVVFTGGIGEMSAAVREKICASLDCIGIQLDTTRNRQHGIQGDISAHDSNVKVLVIPADEELMIARETVACLSQPTD